MSSSAVVSFLILTASSLDSSGPQTVVSRPVDLVSPGNSLEMQIPRPQPQISCIGSSGEQSHWSVLTAHQVIVIHANLRIILNFRDEEQRLFSDAIFILSLRLFSRPKKRYAFDESGEEC